MSVNSTDSITGQAYSERTLAIIKPEAHENAQDIEGHILNNGFMILAVSYNFLGRQYLVCKFKDFFGMISLTIKVVVVTNDTITFLIRFAITN